MGAKLDDQTGKYYLEIGDLLPNKENAGNNPADEITPDKFTAEEFNGIVRALKNLYDSLDNNLYYFNEIDDTKGYNSGDTVTVKSGNTTKLSFKFLSFSRQGVQGSAFPRSGDIADVTISISKQGVGGNTLIYNTKDSLGDGSNNHKPLKHDELFEIDVTKFLTQGGKYAITIEGTNVTEGYPESADGINVSPKFIFTYNFIVTDMSLSFNNETWWLTPYVYSEEGENVIKILFNVGGSGAREIVYTVTGAGYTDNSGKDRPTSVSAGTTSVECSIAIPKYDKVLTIEAWMRSIDDNSVQTDKISRSFMVVKQNPETRQVRLMAINNFQTKVKGGLTHKLFDYAIYNSKSTTGTVNLVFTTEIIKDGETTTQTGDPISCTIGAMNKYEYDFSTISANSTSYTFNISARELGTSSILAKRSITVDNLTSFSPVAGAAWYLNPVGRSNDDSRREEIKNSMTGSFVSAQWNNFAFPTADKNGNVVDGWGSTKMTEYGEEYSLAYLRVPSGSSVNIDYRPLDMAQGTRTIELDYKIYNISDYNIPALKIASENDTVGIKIYPGKICTATIQSADKLSQQIATDDSIRLRVSIVYSRDYSVLNSRGEYDIYNIVQIYINGIIAKVYSVDSSDSLNNGGNLIIGSEGSDIDIYGIRVYNSPLTAEGIVMNYVNRLSTSAEKEFVDNNNDIYLDKEAKTGVGFENTVDQYNVFVFDGDNWPSFSNNSSSLGTLELYSVKNIGGLADPEGKDQSFRITNVTAKGQGTTAMTYAEFNLQFKTNKDDPEKNISASTYTYLTNVDGVWTEGDTVAKTKVPMFKGVPEANAIVMKKNWASSMQDHKMGSVNSFTDAWKKVGLNNTATLADSKVRVSVYQEPMLGFHKQTDALGNTVYEFKGLFTGGPHKGDKQCFGYDEKYGEDLLSIEGATNNSLFALFQVPWNNVKDDHITYSSNDESILYDGMLSWDYNYGKYDSEEEGDKVLSEFRRLFHDPYCIAYICSQKLLPFEGTYQELQEAASAGQVTENDYWTSDYTLCHVFAKTSTSPVPVVEIVDLGEGSINLLEQLGDIKYDYSYTEIAGTRTFKISDTSKTVSEAVAEASSVQEKNEIFKKARVIKFRNEAPKWWDIDDATFHHCWMEFFAGTDQRAKNTYPYSYQTKDSEGNLTQDGKWKWRLDDADTIGPIDNTGIVSKPAYIEVHDKDENGMFYWNGEDSAFWNLIEEAFKDKYYVMMAKMLDAMKSLGSTGSNNTGSISDLLFGFYEKYFLSVKKYFPEVLYNNDAKRYENSWKNNVGKPTAALAQTLGNAYSPESAWFKKRIDYMSSKYSYGDFAVKGKSFTVRIASTSETGNDFELKLKLNSKLYPTFDIDETLIYCNKRQEENTEFTVPVQFTGTDVDFRIHGTKYYTSLGDLSSVGITASISPADFSLFTSLTELNIGSAETGVVKSVCPGITVPSSLKNLYLENYSILDNIQGLESCTKLQEINAVGTKVARFNFASGAPLASVKYPETVQNIRFLNCNKIENKNIIFNGLTNIKSIYVTNSPKLNAIDLIKDVIDAQKKASNNVLKYIKVLGVDQEYTGTPSVQVLELLNTITNPSNKFCGIDSLGGDSDSEAPMISGRIGVEFAYEDTKKSLEEFFKGQLTIDVGDYFIRFEDALVEDKMKELMVSWGYIKEGDTITMSDATKVTTLARSGSSNAASIFVPTKISSFDELKYFTGYTTVNSVLENSVYKGDFFGQDRMTSISLDNILEVKQAGFSGCSSLTKVSLPKLRSLSGSYSVNGWGAFFNCTSLIEVTSLGTIPSIPSYTFEGCSKLEKINIPDTVSNIGQGAFSGCASLTEITIPSAVGAIGDNTFTGTNLLAVYWNTTGATIPNAISFGLNAGINGQLKIYVPKKFYDGVQAGSYGGGWTDLKSNLVAYDFDKNTIL